MEIENWIIKKVKIGDLVSNERNPRTISKEKFEKLKSSIESVGIYKPIVCKHDGTILGGNQRHKAFLEKLPADFEVYVSMPPYELTLEQYDRVLLSDNTHVGTFDFDMLANSFDIELINDLDIVIPELVAPVSDDDDDGDSGSGLADELNKKFMIEVHFQNDMELRDIYDELVGRGYIVKEKK